MILSKSKLKTLIWNMDKYGVPQCPYCGIYPGLAKNDLAPHDLDECPWGEVLKDLDTLNEIDFAMKWLSGA